MEEEAVTDHSDMGHVHKGEIAKLMQYCCQFNRAEHLDVSIRENNEECHAI